MKNDKDVKVSSDKNDLPDSAQVYYSQKFAEEAVDMVILDNNLTGALESITEAISFNPLDHRHYLNRAYIYLRISRPALFVSIFLKKFSQQINNVFFFIFIEL